MTTDNLFPVGRTRGQNPEWPEGSPMSTSTNADQDNDMLASIRGIIQTEIGGVSARISGIEQQLIPRSRSRFWRTSQQGKAQQNRRGKQPIPSEEPGGGDTKFRGIIPDLVKVGLSNRNYGHRYFGQQLNACACHRRLGRDEEG